MKKHILRNGQKEKFHIGILSSVEYSIKNFN